MKPSAQSSPPLPADEEDRLAALESYGILDSLPERAYDDLTRLASEICQVPISLVSLVDRDRQWFKSRHGLEAQETPRHVAFCAHAILQTDLLVVPDACEDDRFAANPLVTGEPRIRFYAGVPLLTEQGHAMGTLCVIDQQRRTLSEDQAESLRALSRQVMALLELRRSLEQQQRDHRRLLEAQRRLEELNVGLEVESLRDDVTGHHNTRFLHRSLGQMLQLPDAEERGLSLVFFDMDGFKRVVDTHGHPVGSRVLREVAEVVAKTLGHEDALVRYGGDEFVALLPGQGPAAARKRAEEMREAIRSHVFRRDENLAIRLTASFGVASHPDNALNAAELLGAADAGLFSSKAAGKDRVSPPPKPSS